MDFQASMSIIENNLERMILDEAAEPKALPFSLLAEITDGFSDELEIGRGGFAVVYKAMLENGDIAVKRLSSNAYLYENEFQREIECLMKVKHKNVIRFLGYCADTQGHVGSYNGKFVMADLQHRLLCFEYLPNGSLHDYIEDASGGLEWRERYKIIKGICEGLCYLHQKNILHLDLKPANILLDENMLPKITDFGVSRCFEEDQTRLVATKVVGTMGYLAPEFASHEITHKFDLYSLGVIITEILTGKKGYQAIGNVLKSWSRRLHISQDNPEWEQIKVCAEIGMECTEFNPEKRPQSMNHIMDRLVETENAEVIPTAEPTAGPMEFLGVHPLELFFPFEYMNLTPCSLYLTNNTNQLVAFRLTMDESVLDPANCFIWLPVNGIVPPRSTYTLVVTTTAEQVRIAERNGLILKTTTLTLGDKQMINRFNWKLDSFFEEVKNTGTNVVHEVRLNALRTPPPRQVVTSPSKPISSEFKMLSTVGAYSPDVHSLDTNNDNQWIITRRDHGKVHIWNNQTQEIVNTFKVSDGKVMCVKFIARKQWFVSGADDGLIHVYSCDTKMRKIISFRAGSGHVYSLALHPTQPYLLSSHGNCMKIWDWDKGWECKQTFYGVSRERMSQAVFNSTGTTIASVSHNTVQVWSLNTISNYSLTEHTDEVNCLDFILCYGQEYLITGSDDWTAKIWDLQKKMCVRTLEGFTSPVTSVLYQAKLHIIITGSRDGCVCLWSTDHFRINSRSPRLERIINTGSGGAVKSLAYLTGRIVIGKERIVAIMNIDNNVNNLEESTDDYSETLSSAYNYTKRSARDTPCKVMSSSSQLLDVEVELIRFPCEPDESISWLVHLTNTTNEHVAFMLMDKRSGSIEILAKEPLYGIVFSRSCYTLIVSTTKGELARAQETDLDLILQSSVSGDNYATLFQNQSECFQFFEDAKEMGNDVHELDVLLKEGYQRPQLGESTKSKPALIQTRMKIISMKNTDMKLCSLDAHPTERWIITGHTNGFVRTWNLETQGPMDMCQVSEKPVTTVKFIARKQWILAMAIDGSIYVYNYACVTKMQKITSFRHIHFHAKSLAVHPFLPYVLSTSGKLWNWDKGWECTHDFSCFGPMVAFNPNDANSFVCASSEIVKVWNSFDSRDPEYTLSGHLQEVGCLAFFTRDDGHYLITGSYDCTAKIWDWQKRECIHTMEVMSRVTCVISLPHRPYLVTGWLHGTVQLWSSTDFRLQSTVNMGVGGPIFALAYSTDSRRVVVGQGNAISIMGTDNEEEAVANEGTKAMSSAKRSRRRSRRKRN